MFNRSFEKLPTNEQVADKLPLIASLTFSELDGESTAPLPQCTGCESVITDIKQDGNYVCPYCGTVNIITEPQVVPIVEEKEEVSLSFLLDAIREKKDKKKDAKKEKKKTPDGKEIVVACIDTSGSMSGGRLESVKKSLIETIDAVNTRDEKTKFVLVTFDSVVTIYLTPTTPVRVPEPYDNMNTIRKSIDTFISHAELRDIGELAASWKSVIGNLTAHGSTALGPAALVSYEIVKRLGKGRVTLLTDGCANTGIGSIGGSGDDFYEFLANESNEFGIFFDVIGVHEGVSSLALNVIGVLSDITGGEIFFVTPTGIRNTFKQVSDRKMVARDTVLKMFLPPEIELVDISGTWLTTPRNGWGNRPVIRLGALDKNRELFFQFKQKGELKNAKVPIQVQMEYTGTDGKRKVKVVKHTVETTNDTKTFKQGYDAELVTGMNVQRAGKSVSRGDFKLRDEIMGETKRLFASMRGTKNVDSAHRIFGLAPSFDTVSYSASNNSMTHDRLASDGQKMVRTSLKNMRKSAK